jgi:hypothetical protein
MIMTQPLKGGACGALADQKPARTETQGSVEWSVQAYRFYWRDPINGSNLIGILPEKRKSSERTTRESVMNWGKQYFGKTFGVNNIFFIQVRIDTSNGYS